LIAELIHNVVVNCLHIPQYLVAVAGNRNQVVVADNRNQVVVAD